MQDKRPNFFLVGAPKTGTSSFFRYLSGHPDIYLPSVKELHYFSCPEVQETYYDVPFVTSEQEYLRLYEDRGDEAIAGDLSPSYLYYRQAAERIRRFQPEARIVISLRNPIKRAISHYLMDVRLGYQDQPLSSFFRRTEQNHLYHLQYIDIGMYSQQILTYLNTFGPDNVLILLYDDLVEDPQAYLRAICEFLDVDTNYAVDMSVHNAFSMPRSTLIRTVVQSRVANRVKPLVPGALKRAIKSLTHSRDRPDLSADETMLTDVYREDIGAVADIIGRDLSHWLAGSAH